MIVVYVNSLADTATFDAIYQNISDCTLLYNPTREEVTNILIERPNETLLCFGHGSPRGLFTHDFKGMLIDGDMAHLLIDREMIGIWCYASQFGLTYGLRGFFTYMFISNATECRSNGCGLVDERIIFEQNRLFAERVNELITTNVPMEDWVSILYEGRDLGYSFVDYNYGNLAYLDGNEERPQLLVEQANLERAESYLWGDDHYIICYTDETLNNRWECVDGFDAMQERVCELCDILGVEDEEIMVFEKNAQLL